VPPDRSGIVDHHPSESAPRLLSTRMSFVPNHVGNLTAHFSTASSENKNRLTQSFPRCPVALCEGIAWCFRSIPFYVCAPNCLENLSAKLLALISGKWRGRRPSFVCRWTCTLPGGSSCSGSRWILSSQLSLGTEFGVDSSAIDDPDCSSTDPNKVSMASQEDSSQDCPKENSYLFP
jgi:hypothetical protein